MDHSYVGRDQGGHQQYNVRKRGAGDALEVQSGISNHFKKLRLNNAPAQIYMVEPPRALSSLAEQQDLMPVDETPSKVYIHDLAAEIAQIEAEEPKDMFLLDIDKKVSALPATLFQNNSPDPNTQLVLYREPSSISIPEEEDAVRKAIIETRRRLRERQKAERENEVEHGKINGNRRYWPEGIEPNAVEDKAEIDPDVMDID